MACYGCQGKGWVETACGVYAHLCPVCKGAGWLPGGVATDTGLECPLCFYCKGGATGPMLNMGVEMAHVSCVIRKLNELLDLDYDGSGEPRAMLGIRIT